MLHISQCRLCHHCHLGETPPGGFEGASGEFDPAGAVPSSATADTVATTFSRLRRALLQANSPRANAKAGGPAAKNLKQRAPVYDPDLDPTVPIEFKSSSYRPQMHAQLALLPVCEECYGCRQHLILINSTSVFLNNTYTSEMGATNRQVQGYSCKC